MLHELLLTVPSRYATRSSILSGMDSSALWERSLYYNEARCILLPTASAQHVFAARPLNQRNPRGVDPKYACGLCRREALERTRRLMEQALPAAQVTHHRRHVAKLSLPDPDDRHVLAAAMEAGADHIVSFNLADFPPRELDPHGVSAVHPDAFITSLCEEHLDKVVDVVRQHRRSLRRPPKSVQEYLRMLEKSGLHHTADWLAEYEHRL